MFLHCAFAKPLKSLLDSLKWSGTNLNENQFTQLLRKQNYYIWGFVVILSFVAISFFLIEVFFYDYLEESIRLVIQLVGLAIFGFGVISGMIFASMAILFNVQLFSTRNIQPLDPIEKGRMRFLAIVTTTVAGFWVATAFATLIMPVSMMVKGALIIISILVPMEVSRQVFSRYQTFEEDKAILEYTLSEE